MVEISSFKGSSDGRIVRGTLERSPGHGEVLIRVTASGLCGTDVHYKGTDMVLGHEGAGIVEAVGPGVRQYAAGDRVGWGYEHDSCGHCKQCLRGTETFCAERRTYGFADLDQGSMASHAVWKEDFIFKIPDAIALEHAAPLMCGGATVFAALQLYGNVRSTDRVGVIGVGGLGHLAIQFAAAMGCDVVVFSGTESKRDEAVRLGATEFYATKGKTNLVAEVGRDVDHLLVTTSAQPDWDLYLPILTPGSGTIYPLSVSSGDLRMAYSPLVFNGLRVQGSLVAPRQIHREMLQFAARHAIQPVIQKFPLTLEGVNEAFRTLEDGKMRYRGVLVA